MSTASFSWSKPGSMRCALPRLFTNSPAPTSATSDSATWPATSRLRRLNGRLPPIAGPPRCFSSPTMSGREALSAGARPNTSAVTSETASVKPSTRRSGVRSMASARQPGRPLRPEHALRPVGDQQAEHARDEREQQPLGEQLAHQPAARGAEREAHARPRAGGPTRGRAAGSRRWRRRSAAPGRPPSAAGPRRSPCSRGSRG